MRRPPSDNNFFAICRFFSNNRMYVGILIYNQGYGVARDETVIRSFHLAPRRPFFAFFIEPCGIAMTIAGTAMIIKIIEGEESETEL